MRNPFISSTKTSLWLSLPLAILPSFPAFADLEVGTVSAVVPAALAGMGQPHRVVSLGDRVIMGQVFRTDTGGSAQLHLADGSSFTIGPNSELVIDKFIYDPEAGTAELAATASRGLFRFIGGAASKSSQGAQITTPIGTAGIRGGIGVFYIDPNTPIRSNAVAGAPSLPADPAGILLRFGFEYGNSVQFTPLAGTGITLTQVGQGFEASGFSANQRESFLAQMQAMGLIVPSEAGGIQIQPDPQALTALLASLVGLGAGSPPPAAPAARAQAAQAAAAAAAAAAASAAAANDIPAPAVMRPDLEIDQMAHQPGSDQTGPNNPNGPNLPPITPPGPSQTLSGIYLGFSSGIDHANTAGMSGPAVLNFDIATNSLDGGLAMTGGSEAYYVFDQTQGYYRSDRDFGAATDRLLLRAADDPTQLCDCDYLQWGSWAGAGRNLGGGLFSLNQGYWITGDLTSFDDLPTQGGASYSGHAIGYVIEDNVARPATGDFRAEADFAMGAISMNIDKFDGRNILGEASIGPSGGFWGSAVGDAASPELYGTIQGGFATNGNDPVGGIFGGFDLSDDGWVGSGIFAGDRIAP